MGITDFEIAGKYTSVVGDILNELPVGSKVAWMGQKHPSINQDKFLYESIMSGVYTELEHYFYDLNNDEFERSYRWDVHGEWNIKGFDLVLGLRVSYLCDSRKKLLSNLRKISKLNQKVVFDFMTGNPVLLNGQETFIKRNNGQTILPFFSEFYNGKFSVQPNHDDQVVSLEHLREFNIQVNNILTFRDGIKRRFYSLCEVSNAS